MEHLKKRILITIAIGIVLFITIVLLEQFGFSIEPRELM